MPQRGGIDVAAENFTETFHARPADGNAVYIASAAGPSPVAAQTSGSIIPDPGPPPSVTPRSEGVLLPNDISNHYRIGAEEIVYIVDPDDNVAVRIQFGGTGTNFTNDGIIWFDSDTPHGYLTTEGDHDIVNNGLIYIRAAEGPVELTSGIRSVNSLVNHGEMYFIAESGSATALNAPDYWAYVDNYGLIAVQALGQSSSIDGATNGTAIGLDVNNTVRFVNHAGAQLLVEATDLAIGVYTFAANDLGGPIVDNRGLIEARATNPDGLSIGIDVVQPGYTPNTIVNSGTIRADFAIYARNSNIGLLNTQEFVQNLAGGVLDGHVVLGIGDDELTNNGQIIGNVWLESGNDTYSGSGTVTGFIDMGFGNDTFTGSNSAERVIGGRGDDNLNGNGGADILVGGFGADTLRGGGGNDTLIGEWGNDTIYTLAADYVEGGSGNDRVVLGDYRFEFASGGTGTDTLVFASGARNFNLAAMVNSGRIESFEIFELQANQQIIVNAAAVKELVDKGLPLRIMGAASNTVLLEGSWTRGTDVTISGQTYQRWTGGGAEVLLQTSMSVHSLAGQSFDGFDAIGSGTPAARLGEAAGIGYSSNAQYLQNFAVGQEGFTVDREEIFYSSGSYVLLTQEHTTITNNGLLESIAYDFYTAYGVNFIGRGRLINNGTIDVQALAASDITYASIGVEGGGGAFDELGPLQNNGEIFVYSFAGSAIGVLNAQQLVNTGLIAAISESGRAVGVEATWGSHVIDLTQTFVNTGLIYAEAGGFMRPSYFQGDRLVPETYVATGVSAWMSLTNDGDIIAILSDDADQTLETVGVYINNFHNSASNPATVINNGLISGTNAIVFEDGKADGTPDQVINNGLLVGDVIFTGGADRYDGSNGSINGVVYGYGGTDTFIGGGETDIFNGGRGNDTLDGGANVDTAIVSGNRSQYTITQTSTGVFRVVGPDGTDTLTAIEYLQFNDQTIRLLPGSGVSVNFDTATPGTYQAAMEAIRDFDGNALGGNGSWLRIGSADVNGDGDVDQILVNDAIGRFATVGTQGGLVYFGDYSWAGETRVAGIYIDPLVQSGDVIAGSANDSQRRFQNDLEIENINRVLCADDFDGDGVWEVYFALTDGTAYLRALMHADGNIRYANYQSEQEVIDYLTANGYDESTFGDWFPAATSAADTLTFVNEAPKFAEIETFERPVEFYARPVDEWQVEYFG